MLSKFSKRFMSTWIKERLHTIQKSSATSVAIVVDKAEIQNGELDFLKGLSDSQEFR